MNEKVFFEHCIQVETMNRLYNHIFSFYKVLLAFPELASISLFLY
jgi:hypothetical protein